MTKRVTLIDYGIGNLLSVQRAFEACGAEVLQTEDPAGIAAAEYLVLPGVGAFADGMQELQRRQLVDPIRAACASGKPVLGICLGMQMLFTESEEHHRTPGLGIIPGRVEAIPRKAANGELIKVPHIGWSELLPPVGASYWSSGLLANLGSYPAVYFVHSFSCVPANHNVLLAVCDYQGVRISAVVKQGNVYGCQFHPEKSGPLGLLIVENFLRYGET